MPGLGQSLNEEEIIRDTRLSRGLVFDNKIAALKACSRLHIRRNLASGEGSKTASNFQEAEVRAEYSNTKRPSGYQSKIIKRVE